MTISNGACGINLAIDIASQESPLDLVGGVVPLPDGPSWARWATRSTTNLPRMLGSLPQLAIVVDADVIDVEYECIDGSIHSQDERIGGVDIPSQN